MLKQIKTFYRFVRVNKENVIPITGNEEIPITFVKVFHKEYPRLPEVTLPEVGCNGELEEVIKSRKSIRSFSKESLSLDDISRLLEGCRINERGGYFERRAYPS